MNTPLTRLAVVRTAWALSRTAVALVGVSEALLAVADRMERAATLAEHWRAEVADEDMSDARLASLVKAWGGRHG